jgi:hypothetical protein
MYVTRLGIFLLPLLCLVPCKTAGSPVAQPLVLAVFDIEDRTGSMSAGFLSQLTDYLATRLGEGGRFRVVPRATVQQRIRSSKRGSYRKCYDEACQVELGRELAASKIVSARILSIGGECRFTLQLYDLARAATDATSSVKTACHTKALPEAIDLAVRRIGGTPGATVPSPSHCPPGQTDVAGHCCWPGQDWGLMGKRCLKEPICPNGFLRKGSGCEPGCGAGKVVVAGHCCWPGQDWGAGSGKCIGKAVCPTGFTADGESCRDLTGKETSQYCREHVQLPCIHKCYQLNSDKEYIDFCMSQKAESCMSNNVRGLDCSADLAKCERWCRHNTHQVGYCLSSCKDSFEREQEKCRLAFRSLCEKRCPDCGLSGQLGQL